MKLAIVDVREPREYHVSMIPGAISVDPFERYLEQYRGHVVVTCCTIRYRSGPHAKRLTGEGSHPANSRAAHAFL